MRQVALRRQLSRADVLADAVRAVAAGVDPEPVGAALLARLAALVPAGAWAVLAAAEPQGIRTLAARGLSPVLEDAARAIAGEVIVSGEPFASADLSSDPTTPGSRRASALAWPLVCRGRTVGSVVALDRRPSRVAPRLSPATEAVLSPVLEIAAIALENALRTSRAEALSVTDDLTTLYNSRYLNQVLRREVKRASRSGRPLSLLFLDLDGFKAVNDTYGHLAGSRALVEAALVIRASGRETDVAARFGGDEFALVLPETGSDGARAVAERVRERIAAHEFLQADGLRIRLTASVGVATLPDVATSEDALLQAADTAMYQVKDRGKNGICVAGSTS